MVPGAIEAIGPATEAIRFGWPDSVRAALELGRLDDANQLLALLADRPAGHVPPFLAAELARGRGLVAAAEGVHDIVEPSLRSAIDAFGTLSYPYWRGCAEIDLANWLTGQNRGSEAAALLETAIATLQALGAAPALARASQITGMPLRRISA
jgi:hypothetical protein